MCRVLSSLERFIVSSTNDFFDGISFCPSAGSCCTTCGNFISPHVTLCTLQFLCRFFFLHLMCAVRGKKIPMNSF